MVLKTISPGCGVRASLMLFLYCTFQFVFMSFIIHKYKLSYFVITKVQVFLSIFAAKCDHFLKPSYIEKTIDHHTICLLTIINYDTGFVYVK